MRRAGVGRGARAVVVDGAVTERDDDAAGAQHRGRRRARDRLRARASRAGRGRRSGRTGRVEPVEVDGAHELGRVRAGRAAEERAFEVHAEHRRRAGPRARPRAARASARTRRAARCRSWAGTPVQPPATQRVDRGDDLVDRRASRSRPRPRRSPGCRRSRARAARHRDRSRPSGGGAGAGRDDAAVADHEPGRRGRGPAFAVEDPRRDERGHPWRSRNNAMRSFTKPSSVRGTRLHDRRAGRPQLGRRRPGSPRCAVRRARRAGSARCRRGPGRTCTRARTARPRRGASP